MQQRIYDVRLVRALKRAVQQALVYSRVGQLGYCLIRISATSTRQSHRLYRAECGPVEGDARSYHPVGLCPIFGFLPA